MSVRVMPSQRRPEARRPDSVTRRTRLAARIIGIGSASLWLLILLLTGIDEGFDSITAEGLLLGTLILLAALGVTASIWHEAAGGTMTAVVGFALCVFAGLTAGRNHAFAMLVSGVPFVIAGSLTLVGWYRTVYRRA